MTLPSSLVSAALNRDINSKANHFGRATQGLKKIFTAFCMSLFLCAAVDKAEGGDRANEGVSLGPGTIQLAQATVAQGTTSLDFYVVAPNTKIGGQPENESACTAVQAGHPASVGVTFEGQRAVS